MVRTNESELMYNIERQNRFEKDYKKCNKRGLDMLLIDRSIKTLQVKGALPVKNRPHKLIGRYVHHWEAHLEPDWLLIWLLDEKVETITLVKTGTHSDLFGK